MHVQGGPSPSPAADPSAAPGTPSVRAEGGFDSGDGKPEKASMSTRKVLSTCALPLLRVLSHVARHHALAGSGSASGSSRTGSGGGPAEEIVGRSSERDVEESGTGNAGDNDIGVEGKTELRNGKSDRGDARTDGSVAAAIDNTNKGKKSGAIPESIITIVGSCLSHVAQEIDLAAEPPGAMESVLSLFLPSAGQLVREQVALTLGAIAGQGFRILTEFRSAEMAAQQFSGGCGGGDFGGEGCSDDVTLLKPGEGGRRGKRLLLWRQFCAGLAKGPGAQVSGTRGD